MDAQIQQQFAERFAVINARYREIKDGTLPWWKLLWEALRPRRSRYSTLRRLRKAQRAAIERMRAKLQRNSAS